MPRARAKEITVVNDRDQAVLFVIDKNGVHGLAAVLTNLSSWMSDGTIGSVDELPEKWLTPSNAR
jgi:hypothetical protein